MKTEPLITMQEVLEILPIKRKTLYEWVHLKKFPHVKVGGKLCFKRSAVHAWIDSREFGLDKVNA